MNPVSDVFARWGATATKLTERLDVIETCEEAALEGCRTVFNKLCESAKKLELNEKDRENCDFRINYIAERIIFIEMNNLRQAIQARSLKTGKGGEVSDKEFSSSLSAAEARVTKIFDSLSYKGKKKEEAIGALAKIRIDHQISSIKDLPSFERVGEEFIAQLKQLKTPSQAILELYERGFEVMVGKARDLGVNFHKCITEIGESLTPLRIESFERAVKGIEECLEQRKDFFKRPILEAALSSREDISESSFIEELSAQKKAILEITSLFIAANKLSQKILDSQNSSWLEKNGVRKRGSEVWEQVRKTTHLPSHVVYFRERYQEYAQTRNQTSREQLDSLIGQGVEILQSPLYSEEEKGKVVLMVREMKRDDRLRDMVSDLQSSRSQPILSQLIENSGHLGQPFQLTVTPP